MRRSAWSLVLGAVAVAGGVVAMVGALGGGSDVRDVRGGGFVGFTSLAGDFGRVYRPDDAFAEYPFVNDGRSPVRLSAHACCGVTARWIGGDEVHPGRSSTLVLAYNSGPGPVVRRVFVTSSDGVTYPLDLRGECLCGVRPNPYQGVTVEIPDTRRSDTPASVDLDSDDGTPFSIVEYPVEDTDIVTVRAIDDPADPAMSHSFALSISTKDATVVRGRLVFRTSHPRAPGLEVPVCIRFVGDVALQPTAFVFGSKARKAGVQVYSHSGGPLDLECVGELPAGLSLEHQPGDGSSHTLSLEAAEGTDLAGAPKSVPILVNGDRREIPVVILSGPAG